MHNQDTELHPHNEQWDALRAGITTPEETAALTAHLTQCPACAARSGFVATIKATLDRPLDDDKLGRELRLRRRHALTLTPERSPRPLSLVAGLAALALGVTLYLGWHTNVPPSQQASTQENNDVYADVDFYLWLSEQGQHADNPS